jgi:hypothetical protein
MSGAEDFIEIVSGEHHRGPVSLSRTVAVLDGAAEPSQIGYA